MTGMECRGSCRVWRWVAYHVAPRWLRFWVVTDVAAQASAGLTIADMDAVTADDLCVVALRTKDKHR